MISVMVSKWVGDAFGREGIYASWIALRRYPWLPTPEFRDRGETAASIMRPLSELVIIHDGESTVNDLGKSNTFVIFP
jgi:chloride channel 3/4/5